MEIRQLKYFIQAAEYLNFTRAAKECGIVQTAMTQQIANLENEIGIRLFDRKIRGFASADAVLTGPETRTSSPVRICRGEDFSSPSAKGLYPCGEGAGYAGGIMSAAVDGLRVARWILENYAGN